MGDELRERVKSLGTEIRKLKDSLKAEGLTADKVNHDPTVLAWVEDLRRLKAQLDEGDELTDSALQAKRDKEHAENERLRKHKAAEEQKMLQVAERAAVTPLVQRKIFHLFQYAGSGDSFHYEAPPRLNAEQTGFGTGDNALPAVFMTEKWDGTTMQATNKAIFRRQDMSTKRRAKITDPSQRYELRLVAWREDFVDRWQGLDFIDTDVRVTEALTPYLPQIAALDDGLCVYFECVHTRINSAFQHVPDFADIRVFDFACAGADGHWPGGTFLPFGTTVTLASKFRLPLVGWEKRDRLDPCVAWDELEAAKSAHYATVHAPLEGYVVREVTGPRIAKARVEYLHTGAPTHHEATGNASNSQISTSALPAGIRAGYLDVAYLAEIGLLSPGFQGDSSE